MRNIYSLLKLNRYIKNIRIKYLGIFLLHIFRKRYYAIFLDPVLACNLRCKMCYFSDEEQRKTIVGRSLTSDEVNKIADTFFHRALKLQIGCGAEPSLYSGNKEIIHLAKEKKVPYIAFTTNGNRLKKENWRELLAEGLNEVTLSLHGVYKESYEFFMVNGSYETFISSLQSLTELKTEYPDFSIRINYTVNEDNIDELASFFEIFDNYQIDILQVRPIKNMGNTEYNEFSWNAIVEKYYSSIEYLRKEAKNRNITFIAPLKEDLTKEENESNGLFESTYFYISSKTCWQDDFNLEQDTYESYAKRTHLGRKLFLKVFESNKNRKKDKENLNYNID